MYLYMSEVVGGILTSIGILSSILLVILFIVVILESVKILILKIQKILSYLFYY